MAISGIDLLEVPTRYKAYFSGLCKGIYPQNMAKNMVLTYLHFRILEFPLNLRPTGRSPREPRHLRERCEQMLRSDAGLSVVRFLFGKLMTSVTYTYLLILFILFIYIYTHKLVVLVYHVSYIFLQVINYLALLLVKLWVCNVSFFWVCLFLWGLL